MSARFVIRDPDGTIRSLDVRDGSRIGPSNEARVQMENGKLVIKCDGAGLEINGRPAQSHALRHFDVVTIGSMADMVFLESESKPVEIQAKAAEIPARPVEKVIATIAGPVPGVMVPPKFESDIQPVPSEVPTSERATVIAEPIIFRVHLIGSDDTFESAPGVCTVGRGPEAQFRIDSKAVSRAHARITITNKEVTVEDLGSANGTKVNDKTVRKTTPLQSGDRVSSESLHVRRGGHVHRYHDAAHGYRLC